MTLRMLVTLDGSPFSERVLDAAADLARQANAEVTLLRIVSHAHDIGRSSGNLDALGEEQASALTGTPGPQHRIRELETTTQAAERHLSEARDYLTPLASRYFGEAAKIEARESRNPAEEIIRVAIEKNIDLIAMATHGRSGIAQLLVGSVAEAVMRSGVAPVLLLRPKA